MLFAGTVNAMTRVTLHSQNYGVFRDLKRLIAGIDPPWSIHFAGGLTLFGTFGTVCRGIAIQLTPTFQGLHAKMCLVGGSSTIAPHYDFAPARWDVTPFFVENLGPRGTNHPDSSVDFVQLLLQLPHLILKVSASPFGKYVWQEDVGKLDPAELLLGSATGQWEAWVSWHWCFLGVCCPKNQGHFVCWYHPGMQQLQL